MDPETLTQISLDVMLSIQEATALVADLSLQVQQQAEGLAADPMQRNLAGLGMLQRVGLEDLATSMGYSRQQVAATAFECRAEPEAAGIVAAYMRPCGVRYGEDGHIDRVG